MSDIVHLNFILKGNYIKMGTNMIKIPQGGKL